jgi:hypothetical protein
VQRLCVKSAPSSFKLAQAPTAPLPPPSTAQRQRKRWCMCVKWCVFRGARVLGVWRKKTEREGGGGVEAERKRDEWGERGEGGKRKREARDEERGGGEVGGARRAFPLAFVPPPALCVPPRSRALHAVQLLLDVRRDRLDLRPQLLLDAVQVDAVVVRDEVDGEAEVAEAARAADAVQVGLAVLGEVKVDNDVDALFVWCCCFCDWLLLCW